MKLLTNTSTTTLVTAGAVLAAVMIVAAPAFAAEGAQPNVQSKPSPAAHAAKPSAIEATYEQERSRCLSGHSGQDQKTCLKEAGAARDEARRGVLKTANQDELANNAMLRCQRVAEEDRPDCRAMVLGQGTRDGSVESGAILKRIDRMVEENPTGAGAAPNPSTTPAVQPNATPERPKAPPRPLPPPASAPAR